MKILALVDRAGLPLSVSTHAGNQHKATLAQLRFDFNMPTQDGLKLRRYARRWIVERFFAWMQWQRPLLARWEYCPANFLGFVQLGALSILLNAL